MTAWHSPHGSGNAPIGPRDEILQLQQEEEAALLRAERALRPFFKNLRGDKFRATDNGAEPITGTLHEDRP